MKNTFRQVTLAMTATALCLGACTKTEVPEVNPGTTTPPPAPAPSGNPSFPGAAGVLWAVNTISSQIVAGIPFNMETGVGSAFFPSANDASVFVDGGTVTLNGTNLDRQSNNAYVSIPSTSNPSGFDFSGGTTHWTVSGANGVPSLDESPSFDFPTVDEITSPTTVDRSSGYTLTVASVSASDSVVFMVGGVVKYKPSGTTSCTFSASELSGVATGPSLVQVSPYSYSHQVIGGKDIYFGKQTTRTVSATVQ